MSHATTGKSPQKITRTLSPAQITNAVRRLGASAGTDRYAAGKSLIATAEKYPMRVYPHFDAVAALLGTENKIIRWNVQRILAALARVDGAGKIEAMLDRYLAFIQGGNMISAANAIVGAGRIAAAKPHLIGRIVPAIVGAESAVYETPECRNVAIAHALDALKAIWPVVKGDAAVRAFVERQTGNTRPAAARRAGDLLAGL